MGATSPVLAATSAFHCGSRGLRALGFKDSGFACFFSGGGRVFRLQFKILHTSTHQDKLSAGLYITKLSALRLKVATLKLKDPSW